MTGGVVGILRKVVWGKISSPMECGEPRDLSPARGSADSLEKADRQWEETGSGRRGVFPLAWGGNVLMDFSKASEN